MSFAWDADRATSRITITAYDAEAVTRLAGSPSHSHTTSGGHRTLDVLHIATAVHLGAERFLTFDVRQKSLAKHEGLLTPL